MHVLPSLAVAPTPSGVALTERGALQLMGARGVRRTGAGNPGTCDPGGAWEPGGAKTSTENVGALSGRGRTFAPSGAQRVVLARGVVFGLCCSCGVHGERSGDRCMDACVRCCQWSTLWNAWKKAWTVALHPHPAGC